MAIALRGTPTKGTGSGCGNATVTCTTPTGVVDNDLLIIACTAHNACCGTDTVSFATPTGWIKLDSTAFGTTNCNAVFYRFASSQGASTSVTATGVGGGFNTTQVAWEFLAYSGVDLTTPVEASNFQNNASSTNAVCSSVTTLTASDVVLTFTHFLGTAVSFTPATGFTNEADNRNGTVSVVGCDKLFVATGSTGTITHVLGAAKVTRCVTMAIKPASTGIAFDSASNSTYQAASSSYSWSHTCTGSNGYLSVEVEMFSLAQTVTSVTYNGALLEFLGAQNSITGAARVELWGIPNPASGANTIAVTLSGSIASAGTAASYTGVNQASPTESFNSAQATNVGAADATVTITTVSDNCWIIAACATDDTAITSNNTSRNNVTGTAGSGANSDNNAAKTPAGAVVMSWTNVGALATWVVVGIALRPATDATLDIGWFPVYSDQSRPNLKVQRDFFFAGIPKLNFPTPWRPFYPDQVPFFKQTIPAGMAPMRIQPLNFQIPWLPQYPNQVPFFIQQRPSGQVAEPVLPIIVAAVTLPWLPTYPDISREPVRVKGNSVFGPVLPLNFPLPWQPVYSDQKRLNFPVQRDFVFTPIMPLNLPLPWLPQYTDLPRPVTQPFKNFFFAGIPSLNFPTPWMPNYPTVPLPVPPVQDTSSRFVIAQTVTPVVNIGWFPIYPASYPGNPLSASALSGFFGPPFPIIVPPATGFVCHIGHMLSHPGVACVGFGVGTDVNGSI